MIQMVIKGLLSPCLLFLLFPDIWKFQSQAPPSGEIRAKKETRFIIPKKSTSRLILHIGIVIFMHCFLQGCWNTLWGTWTVVVSFGKPIMMMHKMQFPVWFKIVLHAHLCKWRWSLAQDSDVRLGESYITIPFYSTAAPAKHSRSKGQMTPSGHHTADIRTRAFCFHLCHTALTFSL